MFNNNRNIFIILMVVILIIFVFLTPVFAFSEGARTRDVPGSQDHPLISRFPGSYIRYYETMNYGEYTI